MTALLIVCDGDSVDQIDAALRARGVAAQRTPRRNLDGVSVTSWMVVAAIGLKMAPAILAELRELLTRDRVKEISVGDITVVNPSRDDVTRLIEKIRELPEGE